MKRTTFFFVAIFLTVSVSCQIQMNSSGKVGIGTSPSSSYKLFVYGTPSTGSYFIGPLKVDPYYNGNSISISTYSSSHPQIVPSSINKGYVGTSGLAFYQFWSSDGYVHQSDGRQKENIRNITNALNTLLQLQGIKYDVKKEYAYADSLVKNSEERLKLEEARKNKIGFIAQDVYKIFPEVVVYDDSTDIYGIEYARMVPLLVEAIKEQQSIIESLQAEIKTANFKSTSMSSEGYEINTEKESTIYQNSPNPFTEETKIEYYLPDEVQNATIYIYNMNGAQLKSIPLHLIGYGNVIINGGELKAGMYMYTLITDGLVIDTKRMILTD